MRYCQLVEGLSNMRAGGRRKLRDWPRANATEESDNDCLLEKTAELAKRAKNATGKDH